MIGKILNDDHIYASGGFVAPYPSIVSEVTPA